MVSMETVRSGRIPVGSGQHKSQAEDPRGRTPHPWGCGEVAGSSRCLGISARKLTWNQTARQGVGGTPGAISGVYCVPDLPIPAKSCFPNLTPLSGWFNTPWLCASCMAVSHSPDSCLHIWGSCRGPTWHPQCARHFTVISSSAEAGVLRKDVEAEG